jgi:hypothetical protein
LAWPGYWPLLRYFLDPQFVLTEYPAWQENEECEVLEGKMVHPVDLIWGRWTGGIQAAYPTGV